ncbi:MAG: hypothetical protein FJ387_13495 [Verrucomicrobia bacterium]|nr:hypothetical protein [Verrucomicrobiota bacterium]
MLPERRKGGGGSFPSTHWSEVERAGESDEEAGRKALGDLLDRYQPALAKYAIHNFHARPEEAQDWFQAFVLESVLTRGLIAQAKPLRGHQFRSYLLTAWHRHILQSFRAKNSLKRQPPGGLVSLDEVPHRAETLKVDPVPAAFDLVWAQQVIREAGRRMQAACADSGRSDVWGLFEARIWRPLAVGASPIHYGELIRQFSLGSPMEARNLLQTGRRMFTRCLRSVVAEYAKGDAAIEIELRELQLILERAP